MVYLCQHYLSVRKFWISTALLGKNQMNTQKNNDRVSHPLKESLESQA